MVGNAVETTVWSRAASHSARNSAPNTARMDVWFWFDAMWGASPQRHQHDFALMYNVERSVAPVGCEQPFHVVEGLARGVRHLLDAARHVIGADRTDIDAELCGFRAKLGITVGGKERRLQRTGAVVRHAGRRRERPRHGEKRGFRKLDQRARGSGGRKLA